MSAKKHIITQKQTKGTERYRIPERRHLLSSSSVAGDDRGRPSEAGDGSTESTQLSNNNNNNTGETNN